MADEQERSEGRPLNADEKRILTAILAHDFPGAPQLRSQLDVVAVQRNWSPGSVSIDLVVSVDTPSAPIADPIVPLNIAVEDDGGEYLGELIVWLSDGRLAGLEYAWVTDEPPSKMPTPSQLRISARDR